MTNGTERTESVPARELPFVRLSIMGGSGSSGTTLLTHLLSRHPAIGSGPEFNCFNHPELYDIGELRAAWPDMKRGLAKPAGYIDVGVFMTYRKHYRITDELIEEWLSRSTTAADFVASLQAHLHEVLGSPLVLEKSPSNVYCFRRASQTLPGLKLIHLVRDGRDVVVSLMRRGFNLLGAGTYWLHDVIRGLEARDVDGYCEVRYEDLVHDVDDVVGALLQHLDADAIGGGPDSSASDRGVYVEEWKNRAVPRAWNQTPSDPVSERSVGQFRSVLSESDLRRLYRVTLCRRIRTVPDLPRTFGGLLEFLGYETSGATSEVGRRDPTCLALELGDYRRRLHRHYQRGYWRLPRRFSRFS